MACREKIYVNWRNKDPQQQAGDYSGLQGAKIRINLISK
jgi:hypothetical protein